MGTSKSTEGRPAVDEEVGFVLEISRSEDGADFKWHIPGSETEHLERGWWLWSSLLSYAGCEWKLGLGHCLPETEGSRNQSSGKDRNNSSNISGPVQLRLWRCPEPSDSRVVRYWLGAKQGQEEEEIGRGTMEPGNLYSAYHPWLQCSELQKRMGCSAHSAGALSFFIRLRSGPETDDDMKSLSRPFKDKSTQTDLKSQQPSDECINCFKEAADCALYQCGHMCLCLACARTLLRFTSEPLCPICRKPVQNFLQVYK